MSFIYNSRCSFYRDVLGEDQFGGRIVITGTLIAEEEPARIDYYTPSQWLTKQQGLETSKTFSLYIRSTRQHPINAQENDYVKITFPPYHPELGVRLRIRGIQKESISFNSADSMLEMTLVRIDETRDNNTF